MEFAGYSTNSEGSRADCKNYLADEAWPRGIRSVLADQPFASLPRVANVKPWTGDDSGLASFGSVWPSGPFSSRVKSPSRTMVQAEAFAGKGCPSASIR